MLIYIWEREKEHKRRGRERERESQAGSSLSVQSPTQGLNPGTVGIMTWAETKSQTLNWRRHPGAPGLLVLNVHDHYPYWQNLDNKKRIHRIIYL